MSRDESGAGFRITDVDAQTFDQMPPPAMEGATCQDCTYWQGQVDGDRAALRRALFAQGTLRGKLALDLDGTAVGFVQYGELEAFPTFAKLRGGFSVQPSEDAWVITCLMTHRSARGRGVAKALLAAVMAQARREGRAVEAAGMEQADMEMVSVGPAKIYRQAGFRELGAFEDEYGRNVLLRWPPPPAGCGSAPSG